MLPLFASTTQLIPNGTVPCIDGNQYTYPGIAISYIPMNNFYYPQTCIEVPFSSIETDSIKQDMVVNDSISLNEFCNVDSNIIDKNSITPDSGINSPPEYSDFSVEMSARTEAINKALLVNQFVNYETSPDSIYELDLFESMSAIKNNDEVFRNTSVNDFASSNLLNEENELSLDKITTIPPPKIMPTELFKMYNLFQHLDVSPVALGRPTLIPTATDSCSL